MESLLKENKIAFILTEVVQGEGGYYVASKKFIKNLRRCATRYGVPSDFRRGTVRHWAHRQVVGL
ncbi:aminotransferase class III-fold pyridoxal phosphate-dependent enzyme [Candidatus Nitrosotalea sp. TS]|uniref:aminotransferase class III-fold pyridoxal phosphate-dependent enzyme n=1 Tax=Candidatus Nitrosotalea sp. TS TaxID=2341020 RepID=UPI001407CAB9|nr:aminotransferase class III-fold pyridoxal phosphate-dependent enzyme [Candidatus Nitrosotalea sp. TS]